MVSLVGCLQSLGHAGEGDDSLVAITLPVGCFLEAIISSHPSCPEGAFLWQFLMRPSLLEDGLSHEVCIFFASSLVFF